METIREKLKTIIDAGQKYVAVTSTDFMRPHNVGYSRGILRVGSLVPTRFSFPYAILIRFNLRRIAAN